MKSDSLNMSGPSNNMEDYMVTDPSKLRLTPTPYFLCPGCDICKNYKHLVHINQGDNYAMPWMYYIGQMNEFGKIEGFGRQLKHNSFIKEGYFQDEDLDVFGRSIITSTVDPTNPLKNGLNFQDDSYVYYGQYQKGKRHGLGECTHRAKSELEMYQMMLQFGMKKREKGDDVPQVKNGYYFMDEFTPQNISNINSDDQ